MNQSARTRTLTSLRRGSLRVLVATDVAARGIDVQGISHVINYDLPNQAEDYVHRIGRTGRAGRNGVAISFANVRDHYLVKSIERFTSQPIPITMIPGLEPKAREFSKKSPGSRPAGRPSTNGKRFGKPSGAGSRSGYGSDRGYDKSGSGRPAGKSYGGYRGNGRPKSAAY
jgi:superfamily II DNA/RNA helicase